MEKSKLVQFIEDGKSTRKIARELNKSQTTIRYWLTKHKLTTKPKTRYKCPCGETCPEKFYGRKTRVCKTCHNRYTMQKGNETKRKSVELLGGKCQRCGYNKCMRALSFHHNNPIEKDLNFRHLRDWSWERVKKELKKCTLLCMNCHAEVHDEM